MNRALKVAKKSFVTFILALFTVFLLLLAAEGGIDMIFRGGCFVTLSGFLLYLFRALLAALLVAVVSLSVFPLVERFFPVDRTELEPPSRAKDVQINRLSGLMMVFSGLYLLVAPDTVLLFSGLFGVLVLAWGALLAIDPEEDRSCYVIETLRPSPGDRDLDGNWAGDPLFRQWARRLKETISRKRLQDEDKKARDRRGRDDPWAVLGISPESGKGEVASAYRELCKRYHPDLVPPGLKAETEAAIKKINHAYAVIQDELKSRQS